MVYLYVFVLVLALGSSWAILWRVPRLPDRAAQLRSLSIIIPARDEEKNIPILLRSLQKQTFVPLEILVVDDHSEDRTAEVAAEYGAKVIQFDVAEIGWVGKSAGCWAGALAARGEWLLFLDADIFLPEKKSLARMIAQFDQQNGIGVLSVQPYHVIQSFYENLSAIFNIMVLAGMNQFSVFGDKLKPAGAFGPSFLSSRELYFEVGGHQVVKDSIMENIDLGKKFLDKEFPVSLFGGKNSLHFRMYSDGVKSLAQGWSKSFATASGATHPLVLAGTSFWIAGAFIVGFTPLFEWSVLTIIGYALFFLHFLRMVRLVGNFNPLIVLFYPLLSLFFVLLFAWSAVKTFLFRKVEWKGRKLNV